MNKEKIQEILNDLLNRDSSTLTEEEKAAILELKKTLIDSKQTSKKQVLHANYDKTKQV